MDACKIYDQCAPLLFAQETPGIIGNYFRDLVGLTDSFVLEYSRKWNAGQIFHGRVHLLYRKNFANNWLHIRNFFDRLAVAKLLDPQWHRVVEIVEPLQTKSLLLLIVGFDLQSKDKLRFKLTFQWVQHPQWLYRLRDEICPEDFARYELFPPALSFEGSQDGLFPAKIHYWCSQHLLKKKAAQEAVINFIGHDCADWFPYTSELLLTWSKQKQKTVYVWTPAPHIFFGRQQIAEYEKSGLLQFAGYPATFYCFLPEQLQSRSLSEVNFYYTIRPDSFKSL